MNDLFLVASAIIIALGIYVIAMVIKNRTWDNSGIPTIPLREDDFFAMREDILNGITREGLRKKYDYVPDLESHIDNMILFLYRRGEKRRKKA